MKVERFLVLSALVVYVLLTIWRGALTPDVETMASCTGDQHAIPRLYQLFGTLPHTLLARLPHQGPA